jgi:hypothetical protein
MITRIKLLILSFTLIPWVFAQDSGQSSSDSGVLVSGNNDSHSGIGLTGRDNSNSSGDQGGDHGDVNGAEPSNASLDPIVIKATNAMMFQITANMKLSQGQISTIQPIIMAYIVKVRNLQQSLEKGDIDGKTMYDQREQLYRDEDKELGRIFTSEQMNIWANIQNH